VTTAAVAAVANAMIPGLPLAGAVALGALVAPPDPVAATAVAGTLRLPRRLVSILEGEGLFNDVTSLVLYQVAVAAVVGGSFSPGHAAGVFALSAVVGVGIGFAVGFAARLLLGRLDEPNLQTVLTLLVPFMAYVVADQLHGSGVLAVLTVAFYLGSVAEDADNVVGRLTGRSFWDVVDLVVTGLAFGVIGLEMWEIFHGLHGDWSRLLWEAGAVVLVLVVVRGLWLFPVAALARLLHRALPTTGETQTPDKRETVVVWWAGMRGVVTIALALALPLTTDDDGAFPERQTSDRDRVLRDRGHPAPPGRHPAVGGRTARRTRGRRREEPRGTCDRDPPRPRPRCAGCANSTNSATCPTRWSNACVPDRRPCSPNSTPTGPTRNSPRPSSSARSGSSSCTRSRPR